MTAELKAAVKEVLKEEAKERTAMEILEEYKKLASLAGDKEYRKKLLEVELDEIFKKMYTLNSEHNALKAKETKPAADMTLVTPEPEAKTEEVTTT